jgi:hypothetical protein
VNLIDFASKALKNIRKTGSLLYIRILVPQFNPLTTGNGVHRAESAFSLGGTEGFAFSKHEPLPITSFSFHLLSNVGYYRIPPRIPSPSPRRQA